MKLVTVLMLCFFVLPFLSAEILIKDTFDSKYSYGDVISVNFSLEKKISHSDYLDSYLVCDGEDVVVGKQYVVLEENVKKTFSFSFPTTLTGEECAFNVAYADERVEGDSFSVSNTINLNARLNALEFSPGESVVVKGNATKFNNNLLEGVVRLHLDSFVDQEYEVSEGAFDFSFVVPDEATPGKRDLTLEAYERDSSEVVINSGKVILPIVVKSKPTAIEVYASEQINPPIDFPMSYVLVDQAGNPLSDETLLLKVFNPLDDIVAEEELASEGNYTYSFGADALKGAWRFNFYFGNVFLSKHVFVGENPSLSTFVIVGEGQSVLRIVNEGNVPYQGVVRYTFMRGEEEVALPVNVDLSLGEEMDYPLDFNGNYSILFGGDSLGAFTLTGASVGLLDWSLDLRSYWFLLAFLGVGVLGYFVFRKRSVFSRLMPRREKKNSFSLAPVVKRSYSPKTKKMYSRLVAPEEASGFKGNLAHMAFFSFSQPLEGFAAFSEKRGWSPRQVGEQTYFILFYADAYSGEHRKLFDFVQDVRTLARKKGVTVSVSLHVDSYENKASFLKRLSSVARGILDASKGRVVASRNFYDLLGFGFARNPLHLRIDGEVVEAYIL